MFIFFTREGFYICKSMSPLCKETKVISMRCLCRRTGIDKSEIEDLHNIFVQKSYTLVFNMSLKIL